MEGMDSVGGASKGDANGSNAKPMAPTCAESSGCCGRADRGQCRSFVHTFDFAVALRVDDAVGHLFFFITLKPRVE